MSGAWKMSKGRVLEGVFAINKPKDLSSANVVSNIQHQFNCSITFAPWMSAEKSRRERESHRQRNRRRESKIKMKVGHGGTLDPLATGVLVIGVGSGTKALQQFLQCTKVYETVVLFGASTDTYDRLGRILKRAPYKHITSEMVEKALGQFRGKFMQLPPLYSALKMNGKPLYEYAREGKQIPREIEKRQVEVSELELLDWMEGGTHNHKLPAVEADKAEKDVAEKVWQQKKGIDVNEDAAEGNFTARKRKPEESLDDLESERPSSKRKALIVGDGADMSGGLPSQSTQRSADETDGKELKDVGPPAARIRMTVTSGFYVRSLCHDLGEALGSQAVMAELSRTRQSQFELGKNVLEYDDLQRGEECWGEKVETMLQAWEVGDKLNNSSSQSRMHA